MMNQRDAALINLLLLPIELLWVFYKPMIDFAVRLRQYDVPTHIHALRIKYTTMDSTIIYYVKRRFMDFIAPPEEIE